jgi:hypothetical protein
LLRGPTAQPLGDIREHTTVPWNAEDWDGWIGSGKRTPEAEHLFWVQRILRHLPDRDRKTVADVGRDRGARLPLLESLFERVLLIDVDGRRGEDRSRTIESGLARCRLEDLGRLRVRVDVALALEASFPDVDGTLSLVHGALVEGGVLVATFPALARTGPPFSMRLGDAVPGGEPRFHEVELQYRLQRAGYQGVRLRRLQDRSRRGPSLLCMAVRRSWN